MGDEPAEDNGDDQANAQDDDDEKSEDLVICQVCPECLTLHSTQNS